MAIGEDISIDLEFSAKDNWYITKELTYRVGIGFCLYKKHVPLLDFRPYNVNS